ncbi:3763_t:CDS:2 [Dentiscutata erythropus]|uniref:3763_t:CDS:1 n=1 Tax=Dentiscutata erythropus TaxID=1348616 RepID=A0A9N9CD73_9GLOM|nr:3763_t:CDS:2 [Dentiscutata erythropus]
MAPKCHEETPSYDISDYEDSSFQEIFEVSLLDEQPSPQSYVAAVLKIDDSQTELRISKYPNLRVPCFWSEIQHIEESEESSDSRVIVTVLYTIHGADDGQLDQAYHEYVCEVVSYNFIDQLKQKTEADGKIWVDEDWYSL